MQDLGIHEARATGSRKDVTYFTVVRGEKHGRDQETAAVSGTAIRTL